MVKKSKKEDDDVIIKNLKGFCTKGAGVKSPGNVPTGHFILDFAIQYGRNPSNVDLANFEDYNPAVPLGLPLGKLVEIFGEEGGGKSSLAYRIAGYGQRLGYKIAWIDSEHSFASNLAKINGCNVDELYYSNLCNVDNPEKFFYAEDVMDSIISLCLSGINIIILDTVANLVTKTRGEARAEQQIMAPIARLLSQNLGKITGYAEKYGVLLIFINQLREKIGLLWGNPETSPGGRALRHNSSVRLKVTKKGGKDANIYIPDEETGEALLIGRKTRIKIEKNRLAKPFLENLEIPIYYESYFPGIEEIAFDTGRQIKLITVRNGIYKWDEFKIDGRKNFIDTIKKQKLVDKLIQSVKTKATEDGILLPPEIMQYVIKKEK